MTPDDSLAHALKIKFGLAPHEPTSQQLSGIKSEAHVLASRGSVLSERDWGIIVERHCPSFGTHAYKGLDNSDLKTLLALAIQAARS